MPREVLADALRRLPRDELDTALRQKYFPIASMPGLQLFAACGGRAAARAKARGKKVVALIPPDDFHSALRLTHGAILLNDATNWLARRHPERSASHRLSRGQVAAFSAVAAVIAAGFLAAPAQVIWTLLSFVAALAFLAVIALRVLCLLGPGPFGATRTVTLADDELPVYSVLVPVFRETAVLGQLLTALRRLDYPSDKLDIKLILEERDAPMRAAVAGLTLPEHFEAIVVPAGSPQTKPRALNYALAFARGELLTIYDAEDVPEPGQLRLAAETFAASEPDMACLQAELVFYNPNENWLTRGIRAQMPQAT